MMLGIKRKESRAKGPRSHKVFVSLGYFTGFGNILAPVEEHNDRKRPAVVLGPKEIRVN